MSIYDLNAYEVIREEDLSDLKSKGILLKHKKSQAKILLFANDDENKVFTIGFRTPAPDSTGVPHIMEHSVLCGSKNFPVKDPFVELVKGSLNTFLNAMTYPDKTLYPVASCNSKDFQNLMHVYMDAVFYPNIYEHDEIFRQEGWSYKLDTADGKLEYNGVVYNEMKGAFSSPEGVLDRVIQNSLFPDTSYANESGGDPAVILEQSEQGYQVLERFAYVRTPVYVSDTMTDGWHDLIFPAYGGEEGTGFRVFHYQDGIGYQNENMEFMEDMDENFCGKKMIADNFIDDMDKGNYLTLRETPLSGN